MPIPVKKISNYTKKTSISDSDLLLMVSENETVNTTVKTVMTYVKNHPDMDAKYATDSELSAETTRAKQAESTLTTNLNNEISRAKGAESTLTTNLNNEISRAGEAETAIQKIITDNKPNWDDKYTKNEIDNKFSILENNIDWKESVATYDDIVKTYPEPKDGWTVNVKDTDYTYRYSGSKWVVISANAIPNATQSVTGLLTASDKTNYDDANSKKHTHSNKSVLDGITSALITTWNTVTNKLDKTGDASNVTNTITTASTRANLSTGEKLSISLGKIAKYFADLKTVAFSGSYNDLSNKPSSMAANGGNSSTVNNHTVNSDVPTNAKFTDTVYTHPTTDGNKHVPANGTTNNGKYLKATATAGSYQWGSLTKDDVINALGYTPGTSSAIPLTYKLSKNGNTILLTDSNNNSTSVIDSNTTYSVATTSANGLMSSTDKKKLDLINNPVATCSTGRATAAKVATLANYTLTIGEPIAVKFTDTAGTANPTSGNLTLNVNGTGAKNIGYFRNGSKAALTYANGSFFYNNAIHLFTYDGTYWLCIDWNADNNTTYSNMTAATASVAGKAGLVPAPAAGKQGQYLRGDGTWATPTNTNTWRGIQDNLTSTSTSDSLSANQGKVLKTKVDNKILKTTTSTLPTTQSAGDIWLQQYE